jgi:hypothetical protein
MSGPFVGSDAWRELLEAPGSFVRFDIIRRLGATDVEDLLRVYAHGSEPGGRVAFGMLVTVSTRRAELPDVPWTTEMETAFANLLAERTERYFLGLQAWPEASGNSTGFLWARLEPTRCVEFLASQPLEKMGETLQQDAFRILASLARDHAACRRRLEAIVEGGGESGLRACAALEDVGITTQERIEGWGRRWREERAPEALDWLYDKWLSYLPVGYPVENLFAVLGPPDDGELPDIYYRARAFHVYIEAHASSGLSGCHRT